MSLPVDFFPRLTRRANYTTKRDGNYYADYAYYRQEIAEDCLFRCGYCDAHQDEIGGERVMQLDHFRPKSRPEYIDLENDPTNLVYACFVCNSQKSNLWPATMRGVTHENGVGFVDPFTVDRSEVFECATNGRLVVKADPGAYLVHLLLLDRPFMRQVREVRHLRCAITKDRSRIWQWIADVEAGKTELEPRLAVQLIRTLLRLLEKATHC